MLELPTTPSTIRLAKSGTLDNPWCGPALYLLPASPGEDF